MPKLSVLEQLMFSTTRITTLCTDGKTYSASGFFYQYELEKNGDKELIPVIITNRHVTEKAEVLNVFMSRSDDQGNPLYEPPYGMQFHKTDLDKFVIHHPNPNVDLSLIFALPIIESFKAENKKVFYRTIQEKQIPSDEELHSLDAVEEILMVGYPNGMWDQVHNMPLVRRGITATPVYLDFNGQPKFLIDAACYPGSSGSPVFIYNNGTVIDKNGDIHVGTSRLYFLGIQHAVPTQTLTGEVKVLPTASIVAESHIMINLGYIIKSRCVFDFKDEILKRL